MLTYQEALANAGGNLSLDEYKRLYQEQCRQEIHDGVVSEESMHLFNREAACKVKIEYRDVEFEMNDAAVMHTLYMLADYPVLAGLAAKRTQASQLDGRACRAIYAAALSGVNWQAVSDHEREFMRRLGVQE